MTPVFARTAYYAEQSNKNAMTARPQITRLRCSPTVPGTERGTIAPMHGVVYSLRDKPVMGCRQIQLRARSAWQNSGYSRASPPTGSPKSNYAGRFRAARYSRGWADPADRRHRRAEKSAGGAIARTRSPSPCRATTTPTVPRGPQRSAAAARLPHCNRQDADPARSVTSTRTMPSPTLTATVILSPGTAVARFVPIGSLLRETIQGGDTWTR
jgi:hypothetical protein